MQYIGEFIKSFIKSLIDLTIQEKIKPFTVTKKLPLTHSLSFSLIFALSILLFHDDKVCRIVFRFNYFHIQRNRKENCFLGASTTKMFFFLLFLCFFLHFTFIAHFSKATLVLVFGYFAESIVRLYWWELSQHFIESFYDLLVSTQKGCKTNT